MERRPDPALDQGGERVVWEFHQVTLNRVAGYGFGIAVSGGRDNPHFTNGDPSIAISDVLKAGPAEGKLQVNDRIMSANGVSLEGVEYATAVQVLRDSGNTVQLVVRRRVLLPPSPEPQTLRIQIPKSSRKKDDFGIVLGCKIYVKDIGSKLDANSLQEGDILLKINNHSTDGMSLKEARKMIESSKEKVNLVVRRETPRNYYPAEPTALHSKDGSYMEGANINNYTSQNVYVQPPTRQPMEDKSNLAPRGRSRGPLVGSLAQLDRCSSPIGHSRNGPDELIDPPRPPPPRPQDYYSSNRQLYDEDALIQRAKQPIPEPRLISFLKEGSVGIRLTGGNEVGIFVTAVQPGSPASLQGLQPGDKILKVNDMDLKGVTREEAVLLLLSLQDQIQLIVQHRRDEYEHVFASQRGDSFHIKAHFNYEQPNKGEMSFRKGDIFHVVDTLHNGVVGSWQVFRIGRNNQEVQKGIIPNKARAEELATAQFNANKKEASASESRGSFFRRRRNSHRRSKSLSKDHWDDVVFGDSVSKFPAYERVVLRHPGFMRPVVLFGPVADLAREKLLKDFPDKFSSPHLDSNIEEVAKSAKTSGIIRLSAIREIMDRGKHALLDITPNAVDRLNYAQFYPIVVFLRADSKHVVKELRAGIAKTGHKSSKKLFEQSQKVEKAWGHVFSATVPLSSPESWYRKVRELIDKNQTSLVWMSESKPEEALADDFLFPMGSLRLSYASSPESDLEATPGVLGSTLGSNPRLVKCSSDPSIATQPDNSPKLQHPPPYSPRHNHSMQGNYEPNLKPRRTVEKCNAVPPELPPRIDRGVKPPRTTGVPRSAQERLFGSEPPNYINATPHTNQSSLDRHNNNKTSSYDSVSSYDSYHQRLGLGPNAHDDLKSCNGGPASPQRTTGHDPYRFTRSTQQPIKSLDSPSKSKPSDYPKYRPQGFPEYGTNKPVPPAKPTASQHSYKPIPPPKPKNYRPPHQSYYPQTNGYQHSKSYSMADNTYSSHMHNGISSSPSKYSNETNEMNGHGSSLDRSTYGRSGGQYYYNVVPSPRQAHHREPSGLDLAHRADQRGSAFELYKKPTEPPNHYMEHGLR